MTTPVDAMTLLNRLMAMVETNVNPPNINYRGDAAAYLETHQALEEALRARQIPFPFPWTSLHESASYLKMIASGPGSWARRRDEIRRLAAPAIRALSAASGSGTPASGSVPPSELRLGAGARWLVGERIGDPSGLGQVYAANDGTRDGAIKFIAKAPGAQRELLLAEDVRDARNVIPVIDSGEYGDHWALVMPRAEYSLSQRLSQLGGRMSLEDALSVLEDVSDTLSDLANRVVHRDIKPQNILFYDDHWCLADFGISRYAEATTEPVTRKYMWTPQYGAPEQWQLQRATSATDMYSLGVTAYQMLSGSLPFPGPDYREQHLNEAAPELDDVPTAIAALIAECLYKAPEARPQAADFRARVASAAQPPQSRGLSALRDVHKQQVEQRAAEFIEMSSVQERERRRQALSDAARQSFIRISDRLRLAVSAEIPDASILEPQHPGPGGWSIDLGHANLRIDGFSSEPPIWSSNAPAFEVIASSTIAIEQHVSRYGYEGRSHALWFGDVQQESQFLWFEVAFMTSGLLGSVRPAEPYALDPDGQAASAIGPGMASIQVGWPFTPLVPEDLTDFIDRWAQWLAAAANGDLQRPGRMPERETANSWRTS